MTKVMLVDGNSLTYRAFFALPTDITLASGQVTNAVYGFTSMLLNLVRDHQPTGLAVAFDRPEPTFRHARVETYKANRSAAPDILREQMGLVRQVVETFRMPILDCPGIEADDIIATLATEGRDRGDEVLIVTGDRDAYQLVEDPLVKVLYNMRGVTDYAIYDEAGIKEKTGVTPADYPQYAALRGDPSDNLPGVPGVGPKTAAKLINTYGDLDGVFANVEKNTPKLKESLIAHEEQVRRNATATPLVRDVPLDVVLDSLRMGQWDPDAVRELFRFLEFNTLYPRFVEATGAAAPAPVATEKLDVTVRHVVNHEEAAKAVEGAVSLAAAWGGEEGRSALLGVAVSSEADEASWIPSDLLPDNFGAYSTHKAKELMRALDLRAIELRGLDVDTAIAAYLLDPAESQYLLEDLALRYLGLDISSPDAPPPGQLDLSGTAPDPAEEAGRRAVAIARLAPALSKAMDSRGLQKLYDDIERPLVRVLARMEKVGVRVDVDQLRRQPQKKTKTGFSTDAASLEKLRGLHPVIDPLLRYREVEKLRSTYGESLLGEVAADGRIHASFNQTVARTGRLSSDRPNLHNIPIRTEEGRRIRRAFIPAEGRRFLVADYNQIELRVIAHLARDPGLISAFASGEDIHRATASRLFAVDPSAVTVAQRSKAKMVSYGLAYGMESFGLGQRLGIPTADAAVILDAYFEAFPNVKAYMDRTVIEARMRGYTETLFGRRRPIPELSNSNFRIRQAGERMAMNAGIQGLAADIFKVALVRIHAAMSESGIDSRLILQVHDEVLVEVPEGEVDSVGPIVIDIMRNAAQLDVPLEVNVSWGPSWASAKS